MTARYDGCVTCHASCSGLRELGVKQPPRRLLQVAGLSLREMVTPEVCCGFGGTFSVEYPEISHAMVGEKSADVAATGAGTLLAGDLGSLLNMAGKLQRQGRAVARAPRRRGGRHGRSCRHRRAGAGRRAAQRRRRKS